jgi:hypothetical protein
MSNNESESQTSNPNQKLMFCVTDILAYHLKCKGDTLLGSSKSVDLLSSGSIPILVQASMVKVVENLRIIFSTLEESITLLEICKTQLSNNSSVANMDKDQLLAYLLSLPNNNKENKPSGNQKEPSSS